MRISKRRERGSTEFLPDTTEQIGRSIDDVPGLQDNLDQAVQVAIVRSRGCPQDTSEPATNEAKEGDSP